MLMATPAVLPYRWWMICLSAVSSPRSLGPTMVSDTKGRPHPGVAWPEWEPWQDRIVMTGWC